MYDKQKKIRLTVNTEESRKCPYCQHEVKTLADE